MNYYLLGVVLGTLLEWLLKSLILVGVVFFFLWVSSCGKDGEEADGRTEVKMVTEDCQSGTDGENGVDGEDGIDGRNGVDGEAGTDGDAGVDGSKGDQGDQGSPGKPGESGMDGSDCRITRQLVYNKDGELRDNRCDVYLTCAEDEVFITRQRTACD